MERLIHKTLAFWNLLLSQSSGQCDVIAAVIVHAACQWLTHRHPAALPLTSDAWCSLSVSSNCMLCCEWGIMRQNKDNRLALLSKTSFQSQTNHGLELERIHADLEVGKSQTQWSHRHLYVELRHLREKAESNLQKAVRELVARRGHQKNVYFDRLARDINVKDTGQYSTSVSTGKEASCSCSRHTHINLELLLLTLYEEIDAVFKLHHRQESEREKAILLCHLLQRHRKQLQGRQRAVHPSYNLKSLSKKPAQKDGVNSCHSASRSSGRTSGRGLCAADPSANATALDTCQCSLLKNCDTLNAGRSDHPPCGAPRTGESTPSKCLNINMEVSYITSDDFMFLTVVELIW